MTTKTKNDRTAPVKEWILGSGGEKKLRDMMGLSDDVPAASDETTERTVPDEAGVYTSPEERHEATGFTTAAPITTDDPEMVAAPDGDGEISGHTIIPIEDDEVSEGREGAVSVESDEQTLPCEVDNVSEHTPPTLLSKVPTQSFSAADNGCIAETQAIADTDPIRRTVKQRKSNLSEYRATFLLAPKIIDRKPVFVSRTTRDRLNRIVRLFGERGMSVSGLIENIALHHLAVHEADIEHWRKM